MTQRLTGRSAALGLAALALALFAPGCTPDGGNGSDPEPVVIPGLEQPEEPETPEEPEEPEEPEQPEEPEEPEEPAQDCTVDNDFAGAAYERLRTEDDAVRFLSFSSVEAPTRALIMEFPNGRGGPVPGTYDLAEMDLNDCQVCLFAIEGLNLQTGDRVGTLLPTSGTLEITQVGEVGETFVAELRGVTFEQHDIRENQFGGGVTVSKVDGGVSLCAAEHRIEQTVLPTPARVGDSVHDFQLQNCETEEFVSMHEMTASTPLLWVIGSAGWCTACHQYLPGVFNLMNEVPDEQAKLMIVVGENPAYQEPSLRYCRRYASQYGLEDASLFYIDHDGFASFGTMFSHLNVYTDANGAFGLPWNALLTGEMGDVTYRYSDRSGQPESLVDLLQEAGLPVE